MNVKHGLGLLAILLCLALAWQRGLFGSDSESSHYAGHSVSPPDSAALPQKNPELAHVGAAALGADSYPGSGPEARSGPLADGPKTPTSAFGALTDFLHMRPDEIRVCDALGGAVGRSTPPKLEEILTEAFNKPDENDPFQKSLLVPMSYAFNIPQVKSFFEEAASFPRGQDDEFVRKSGIQSRLSLAVAEVEKQRSVIESLAQRAYHVFILAKIIGLRPNLLSDPSIRDFCDQMLGRSQEGSLGASPAPLEDLRALTDLMRKQGVTTRDIGFDPRARLRLQLNQGPRHFGMFLRLED